MTITPLDVFEELRFILEQIAILLLLFLPSSKRRSHFWWRLSIGFVLTTAACFIYFPIDSYASQHTELTDTAIMFIYIGWYVFLTLISLAYIFVCFDISLTELFFKGVIAYAAQHYEYAFINQAVARGLHPEFRSDPNQLWIYILLSVFTCALWYFFLYKAFSKVLNEFDGSLFSNTILSTIMFAFFFLVVVASAFVYQLLFQNNQVHENGGYNYPAVAVDCFSCLLILFSFYFLMKVGVLNKEKAIYNQLLHEKEKQYELEKQNVDIINQKCHDMKHQLNAMKNMTPEERDQSIQEVSKAIMIYDAVVKTNNEALNTILNQKFLFCQANNITLSCVIDDSHLDQFSTLELYTLFGNALDNAIESVMKLTDPDKRTISVVVNSKNQFLLIQLNNFYEGTLQIRNGYPVTSKEDRDYHGYGLKSINNIVTSHDGRMAIKANEGIFTLEIMIPLSKQ